MFVKNHFVNLENKPYYQENVKFNKYISIKNFKFIYIYCLLNDKKEKQRKALKKFGLRTWCTKELFG